MRGKKYITYKEYDNEIPEKYKLCTLKIENDNCITLIKNYEDQTTKLILEKGKRHYCPYYTEFGMLTVGIFTNEIDFRSEEPDGELYLKYSMDINSSFVGINEVKVKFRKKENEYV